MNQSEVCAITMPRGQTGEENNAYQTGFVTLNRGNSITDRYLVKDGDMQGSQFSVSALMRKESEINETDQKNKAKD